MSEVMLTIMDADRAIHGETHGSVANRVVAALSAEPETIEELEPAVARFIKPTDEYGVFDFFDEGICEEAWDAGIVIIDLAARVAAGESTYSSLQKRGRVQYHDGSTATDISVNYQVPDDWLFISHIDGWQALAQRRRDERVSTPPLDVRKVIYGKVTEFIVRECSLRSAVCSSQTALTAAESETEDPIADIHARWLMTQRSDLCNQSPRNLLLAKHGFISLDLQWRGEQWAFVGECPPGLSPESAAYRFGGFGIHENVLYYELVRYLLEDCWHRVSHEKNVDAEGCERSEAISAEIERLEQLKENWLHTPQNDLHDMSPFDVIEMERMRIPVTVSAEQMVLDDDFELYQMLQEDGNPTFWHLDGVNMDDDFPFSFHQTREEWEEERRSWEASAREWEERRANLTPFPSPPDSSLGQRRVETEEDGTDLLSSVWNRSYMDWDSLEGLPPESAIEIMLHGMAMHLEELEMDLRDAPLSRRRANPNGRLRLTALFFAEGEELVSSLRRDFADLRRALRSDNEGIVEECLQRLRESLANVAMAIPHLTDKCVDLHSQLDWLGNLFES